MILLTNKIWADHAAIRRRVKIVLFALLLRCVLRLETLDEIDKIASFHKSGDDGAPIPFDAPVTTVSSFVFMVCGLLIKPWKAELAL